MTLRPLTSTTAQEIAAAVPVILRERAENDDPRNWSNIDSYRRFVGLLRTGMAWRIDGNSVSASVSGLDSDTWGYVVAEAIDTATQDYDLPRGHIHQLDSGWYRFDLACECGGACTLPTE